MFLTRRYVGVLGQARWTEQPAGDRIATPLSRRVASGFRSPPRMHWIMWSSAPFADWMRGRHFSVGCAFRLDRRRSRLPEGDLRSHVRYLPTPPHCLCRAILLTSVLSFATQRSRIGCSVGLIRFCSSACPLLGAPVIPHPRVTRPITGDTSPTRLMLDASRTPVVQMWYRYHLFPVSLIATKKCLRRPCSAGPSVPGRGALLRANPPNRDANSEPPPPPAGPREGRPPDPGRPDRRRSVRHDVSGTGPKHPVSPCRRNCRHQHRPGEGCVRTGRMAARTDRT
jgi:hypothetical protein